MLGAYNGTNNMTITDKDIAKIESLGFVSELKKREAEQNRLKKKQEETKKLKSQVKQELDKQNYNKDLGDINE